MVRSKATTKDILKARAGIQKKLASSGTLTTKQWMRLTMLDKEKDPRTMAIATQIEKNHKRLLANRTPINMGKWTEIYTKARAKALG